MMKQDVMPHEPNGELSPEKACGYFYAELRKSGRLSELGWGSGMAVFFVLVLGPIAAALAVAAFLGRL